jgi:hypothetical protein
MSEIIVEYPTDKLEECINEKKIRNAQLNFAANDYISLKMSYQQKANELLLTTNFKEVLDESRPTVAMKDAWIENQLMDEKMEMNIAKENVNAIKRDIDIINDEIQLWEYKVQLTIQKKG